MDRWGEVRTAFQVAKLGTISAAADALGVHHATIIRHIDALEKRLGTRLFQRHARGYTATEAGRDLFTVAMAADEQFAQLANRIRGQGETVAGELTVTTISGIADLMTPVLVSFQALHPKVIVRFVSDMRVLRLDYGEAHVAIRAGAAPNEPDNVVQPFVNIRWGMYASDAYVAGHGVPSSTQDFAAHRFVGSDNPENRAPFYRWLRDVVPDSRISFRVTEPAANDAAIRAGAGIGFMPAGVAAREAGLVEVMAPRDEWTSALWLVTHVDLHRTLKVQGFLAHLKAAAKEWGEL
jgi:DNA-binding transcriptional LysR family regulator